MAGSLQAVAEMYRNDEMPSMQPDKCPQGALGEGGIRHCLYHYAGHETAQCPYLYGVTLATDPTVRVTLEQVRITMTDRGAPHHNVRVLCMLARPVDRAGA